VFKTRIFDQVGLQFSPEAFCFLEGVNDESFLSFNELFCCPNLLFEDLQPFVQGRQFSSAVRGVSWGVQGSLVLIKPLAFRLQYRLSTEEEVIGSGVSAVGLAKLATFSTAFIEVAKARVADGVGASSTSPLEVSSGCRGSG
jgi:hypothetical protein